ncbi:unnamed protein product [Fraxinus pennsylvanica]|uniref:Dehydrin n=1 Tax=Fraxinus pennsylvanica TaxID=56036 RepID=A0AAD1ZYW3_9LAMI|nr:unnamed protein product [Fraxinus pennsylvanica]
MAEEVQYNHHNIEKKSDEPCDYDLAAPVKVEEHAAPTPVEATDRGLFDFIGKKGEEKKCEEEVIATQFEEKVQVSEPECKKEEKEEEKKHEGLLQKLHRSSSSSSSSSDEEEVEEGGEKKKKKKGLKEKIKGKISGDKKEEEKIEKYENTSVPVEKCDEIPVHEESEEKKGFLDKIKEKLPGGQKKAEEVEVPPPPPPAAVECANPDEEAKEKKGFLDKIKEKLPGYHSKTEEEKEKEKEKESACH